MSSKDAADIMTSHCRYVDIITTPHGAMNTVVTAGPAAGVYLRLVVEDPTPWRAETSCCKGGVVCHPSFVSLPTLGGSAADCRSGIGEYPESVCQVLRPLRDGGP